MKTVALLSLAAVLMLSASRAGAASYQTPQSGIVSYQVHHLFPPPPPMHNVRIIVINKTAHYVYVVSLLEHHPPHYWGLVAPNGHVVVHTVGAAGRKLRTDVDAYVKRTKNEASQTICHAMRVFHPNDRDLVANVHYNGHTCTIDPA